MKEDRGVEKPWPKPAYNVQVGTEGQFIVGFSVHNRAGNSACLIPHLEQVRKNSGGQLPKKIVADAAYGSEEGQRLRAARSTEVETVFGHVKHNMGFRRFHLQGLEKVKTEWGLVSIAHNLRKLAA